MTMERDFRNTDEYKEVKQVFELILEPGLGKVNGASDINASPDGCQCVFTGSYIDRIEGHPYYRVSHLNIKTGSMTQITYGPNSDRMPKFSPDGKNVVFLSDRIQPGIFQAYLIEMDKPHEVVALPPIEGTIEEFFWSPNGRYIMFNVAGLGADTAGKDGATTTFCPARNLPSWMPEVDTGNEAFRWRRIWIYNCDIGKVELFDPTVSNIWHSAWCGNEAIAAITSERPGENDWYTAKIELLEFVSGKNRVIYKPSDQIGCISCSPSGNYVSFVEACCSDRDVVFGELKMINMKTGESKTVDTCGADVADLQWRNDKSIVYAAERGFELVIGEYYPITGKTKELFNSDEISSGIMSPAITPLGVEQCLLETNSFLSPPAISLLKEEKLETIASFENEGTKWAADVFGKISKVIWNAPDGLEIYGWLLEPKAQRPHPVIMDIHGGPVWLNRNNWQVSYRIMNIALVNSGFAVFYPNPRGSTGRGQDFIRWVIGDMGGKDTYDYLSGLDTLVEQGIADAERIGVRGTSYGGFMTSWLVTQDQRFAAAVSVSPLNDWISLHYTSNVTGWDSLYLGSTPADPNGNHFLRSPVIFADRVKTPVLNIAGTLDRIAPPTQAVEFHRALKEHGVESVLLIYPEEGHGVKDFNSVEDYTARILYWFRKYMGSPEINI